MGFIKVRVLWYSEERGGGYSGDESVVMLGLVVEVEVRGMGFRFKI